MSSASPPLSPGRLLRGVLLAAAVGALAGCGGTDRGGAVPSDSTYVEVMAHLVLIRQTIEVSEPERADSARRSVLEAHGVSAEALRRYAERHGADPSHMERVWEAIAVRTDSLARARAAGNPGIRRVPPGDSADRTAEPDTSAAERSDVRRGDVRREDRRGERRRGVRREESRRGGSRR